MFAYFVSFCIWFDRTYFSLVSGVSECQKKNAIGIRKTGKDYLNTNKTNKLTV